MKNRELAYTLTVACYRDNECWEERHVALGALDMDIYDQMLIQVQEKLDRFLPYVKYLRMDAFTLLSETATLPKKDQDILLGLKVYGMSSHTWQKAEKLTEPIGENMVTYLLNGRLKTACENGEILNNDLMKEINMDVHNRMFTLIEKKRI